MITLLAALPCPCCGSTPDVGVISSLTYGVQCNCGLTLEKRVPNRRPPCCKSSNDVYVWTTNKAIKAWNRRTKKGYP